MKRKLLLISNSTNHGERYLEHCAKQCKEFFSDCKSVGFVPFALHDTEGYYKKVKEAFEEFDICKDVRNVAVTNPKEVIESVDGIFIGGGNTFRLLKTLYEKDLIDLIRKRVFEQSLKYMGASAGTNVACLSIRTTNDMPIVYPPSFNALALVPFQINPHFIDEETYSLLKHKGETREQRIEEFHEENDTTVIGIREGAMLLVEDDKMTLLGKNGAKVFEKNKKPFEKSTGDDLSSYL
ncbi:hypothetical protein ABK040_000994 [Willaertia magna]